MEPTQEQIAAWIEEYIQLPNSTNVMNRKWEQMFIHRLHKEIYAGYNDKASDRWKHTIESQQEALNKHISFDKLYKAIKGITVHGIGELTKYDTATCIGCPNRVYPEVVYLHAGTAEGAKALGISGKTATKELFVEVCDAFGKLEPIQIEDFLCIYKAQLAGKTYASPRGCCGC